MPTTLVLLLLPLSRDTVWGWTSAPTLSCLAAAAVAAAAWIRTERAAPAPLVDVRILVHRPVLFAHLAGLLLGYTMFSQFILVSALVQTPPTAGYGFGASVLRASVEYLLPPALAYLAASRLGGVLVRRSGPRRTLALGAVTGAASFALTATAHGTSASVIVAGVLIGIAISFGFTALPAVLLTAVPPEHSAAANGVNSVARSVGDSPAGALVASVVAAAPPGHASAESRFTLCFALAGSAFLLIALFARFGMTTPGNVVIARHATQTTSGATRALPLPPNGTSTAPGPEG